MTTRSAYQNREHPQLLSTGHFASQLEMFAQAAGSAQGRNTPSILCFRKGAGHNIHADLCAQTLQFGSHYAPQAQPTFSNDKKVLALQFCNRELATELLDSAWHILSNLFSMWPLIFVIKWLLQGTVD